MLEHKIEGRPLPTVQWFKDGVPLSVMPKLFKLETTNSLVDQYKYRVTSKLLFVGEYNKIKSTVCFVGFALLALSQQQGWASAELP